MGRRSRSRRHHRSGRRKGSERRSRRRSGRERGRSKEKRIATPRNLQNLGNHGCGDHEKDVDEFIRKNELSESTVRELRACDEFVQKKVMGTDGGVHIFHLLGKVRSPDAVVFSRIRKENT